MSLKFSLLLACSGLLSLYISPTEARRACVEPVIDDPVHAIGWCKTPEDKRNPVWNEPRDFCKWCGPTGVYETIWKRNARNARRRIYRNMSKMVCNSRACYTKTDAEMADWSDAEVWAYCNKYMKNCYTNLSNTMLRPVPNQRYIWGEPRRSILCQEHTEACGHWTMLGKYWDEATNAWVVPQ